MSTTKIGNTALMIAVSRMSEQNILLKGTLSKSGLQS